jgi:co-chaperonin GroES (HSP10)
MEEEKVGVVTPETKIENPETQTTVPNIPEKEKSFKELLEAGEIKVGDKIAFTVFGGDKETVVTVDQAFLNLLIMEETYYKQFYYRVYET